MYRYSTRLSLGAVAAAAVIVVGLASTTVSADEGLRVTARWFGISEPREGMSVLGDLQCAVDGVRYQSNTQFLFLHGICDDNDPDIMDCAGMFTALSDGCSDPDPDLALGIGTVSANLFREINRVCFNEAADGSFAKDCAGPDPIGIVVLEYSCTGMGEINDNFGVNTAQGSCMGTRSFEFTFGSASHQFEITSVIFELTSRFGGVEGLPDATAYVGSTIEAFSDD